MRKGTFERHLDAIKAGEVTRSNVIGIRKALNNADRLRKGLSTSRTAPKVTPAQADILETALEQFKPRVVGDLVKTGKTLLRSQRYQKRWGEYERRVIDCITGFRLLRFDDIGDYCRHAIPVYLVEGKDGRSFAFRNIPWQSDGDGPEIVARN